VTIDGVRNLLISISSKTSPLDVLPVPLLKDCADVFAPAITILANLSLQTGRFPSRFKSVQVLRSHANSLLQELHWLPVEQRITYKLAVLTFKTR